MHCLKGRWHWRFLAPQYRPKSVFWQKRIKILGEFSFCSKYRNFLICPLPANVFAFQNLVFSKSRFFIAFFFYAYLKKRVLKKTSFLSTPGFPRVPRGTQGYPWGTPGCPGVPQGTPGYPGEQTPGSPRVALGGLWRIIGHTSFGELSATFKGGIRCIV